MTEHDDIAELLGAYALDAVDPDEAALVEDHLRECPRCAAEVAEHREVAAMLAHSGAPAPEGIWERIVEGLEEPPPAITLPVGASPSAGVVDLGARRRDRVATRWVPAAAAAVVLLVAGLLTGFALDDGDGGRGAEVAGASLEELARTTMNDPDARKVMLTAPDGEGEMAAPAAVGADGSGFLMGGVLPALDPARTYQLWGISDRVVVSLGVLGASPDVVAFHVDEGIHTLAITEEEAGGVPSSVNPPSLVGELS